MTGAAGDSAREAAAKISVLLAAGSAGWESDALARISAPGSRVVLVKRCLDLHDLLATAATGTAQVAIVSPALPGLDVDSIERLSRAGVRAVAVTAVEGSTEEPDREQERLARLGVTGLVGADALHTLPAVVRRAAQTPTEGPDEASADTVAEVWDETAPLPGAGVPGRLVVVWGPHGAPGRTTFAIGLAAELAERRHEATLLDLDPQGGSVGQHLAVLDEVSGLLAAARSAGSGRLDAARLASLARQVNPFLRLVTGLPRPDRWAEVRPQALATILETVRELGAFAVVDAGFALDRRVLDDPFAPASRDQLSMAALAQADDVFVVASADPVGLTRLARSLLDLREVRPEGADHVVVNRMRPGLGWSARDVVDMVARVTPAARVHFLPEDRTSTDRALVAGRTLVESGDGPLRRAVAEVADRYLAERGPVPPGRPSRQRARRAARGAARHRRSRSGVRR